MQVVEQDGLPERKTYGRVQMGTSPMLYEEVIGLQGCRKKYDWFIGSILFDSNEDRDAYLKKITQDITDELFTLNGELRVGEMCEVRDYEHKKWETRRLLAILPTHIKMPFIVERPNNNAWFEEWRHARPLCKRIEPMVETNGEIITYTWEAK